MKIVIKVGTSTLVDEQGYFKTEVFERLCQQIANIINAGHEVVLVTSGACGLGKAELLAQSEIELNEQRKAELFELVKDKQICATVGQSSLMELYKKEFRKHKITVGQTLLAGKQDFKREITHSTLNKSLTGGLLQIINANDAVFDEQMRIGDNDTLSAEVAKIIKADKLFLVTDEIGLYTDYKDEKLRKLVMNADAREINNLYKHVDMESGSKGGTGKMKTKLDAAKIATRNGCDVDILSNTQIEKLLNFINGDTSIESTHFSKSQAKNQLQQFWWNVQDDLLDREIGDLVKYGL